MAHTPSRILAHRCLAAEQVEQPRRVLAVAAIAGAGDLVDGATRP